MKHFNKLLLAAALLLSGVGAAHAAEVYVPKDIGSAGVFTNTWTFSTTPTGASDDPFAKPGAAGAGFDDYFDFNVPDSQTIFFNVYSSLTSGSPGVSFTGVQLLQYGGLVLGEYDAANPSYVRGGGLTLTSGTYAFEVVGTYLVAGGTYGGQLSNTSPVPEPSAVLMLLMGLAVMAGAARLRKNQS